MSVNLPRLADDDQQPDSAPVWSCGSEVAQDQTQTRREFGTVHPTGGHQPGDISTKHHINVSPR